MRKIDSEEILASVVAGVRCDRRGFLKNLLAWSAAVGALPVQAPALARESGQDGPAKEPESFEANAEIRTIDKATGVVTAKLNSGGETFHFTLVDRKQLEQLRVGQPLFANLDSRQVFVDDHHLAGRITDVPAVKRGATRKGLIAQEVSPSWSKGIIMKISTSDGIVTAKDKATGKFFQFRVANPGILGQLHLGQKILANFAGRQVSFDGKAALGAITKGPQ